MFRFYKRLSLPRCSLLYFTVLRVTSLVYVLQVQVLKMLPVWKIVTTFREFSRVLCYNLKYIYRHFYTLHNFSFTVSMWFFSYYVARHVLENTQISNNTNPKRNIWKGEKITI